MAHWTRKTKTAIRVDAWPIVRCTTALCLAAGLCIDGTLDVVDQRQPGWTFAWAALVALVGLAISPWKTLWIDCESRRMTTRTLAIWGRTTRSYSYDEIQSAELTGSPGWSPWRQLRLCIRSTAGAWSLPLGSSWRGAIETESLRSWEAVREASPALADGSLPLIAEARSGRQLSLRRLLVATALVAAVLAISRARNWQSDEWRVTVTTLEAIFVGLAALFYRPGRSLNERFWLSVAVMYAPYSWLVERVIEEYSKRYGNLDFDAVIAMPGIWIVWLYRSHDYEGLVWGGVVLAELAIALAVARAGWKWTLPWAVLLLLASTFASLMLNAGMRA